MSSLPWGEGYREVRQIGTSAAEPGLRALALALEGLGRLALIDDPAAGAELLVQARTARREGVRPVWRHERAEGSAAITTS